jgi:hypothetical protein
MLTRKILLGFLGGNFFISFALSQNIDHTAGNHSIGSHFVKRVEYNLILEGRGKYRNIYNLKSKAEEEKLFFGNFNAPVEFFYSPSFDGASGFRIVRDSLGATILEIKYISNYGEVTRMRFQMARDRQNKIDIPINLIDSLPREIISLIWDYNNHRLIAKKSKELPEYYKHYKVESLFFPISKHLAEKLYERMVSFIGHFKAKGVPPIIEDGYSVTFRTVVDDEAWSLEIHMPEGNALKMADLCRQIITDAIANEFDEAEYLYILNEFD